MKKFLSILLITSLVFSVFSFNFFAYAADKEYLVVSANGADLYKEKQAFSQKIAIVDKGTILKSFDETAEFVKVFFEGSYGWLLLSDLVLYEEKDSNITKITIEREPFKKEYYENDKYWFEAFDDEGLILNAHYKDGSVKSVKGYTIYSPVMSKNNSKAEVFIAYKGHYVSFNINIRKHPISHIKIDRLPNNLSFKEGSELDLDGILVNVYYTNDWPVRALVADDFLVEGYDKDKPGSQKIKLIYKYSDINATFNIDVIEKVLDEIEITQKPNKLDYYGENRILNLSGIKILAHYDNGATKDISPTNCKYIWKDENPKYDEKTEIIVSYSEKSVLNPEISTTKSTSFEIMLHELKAVGIRVEGPSTKDYLKGEKLDMKGFQLFLDYNNSDKVLIAEGFEFKQPDMNIVGTHIINIKYKGFETSFKVNVWSTKLYGDVNLDKKLTAADARLVLRYSAKLETFSEEQKKLATLGTNTVINASKARSVLRMAARLDEHIYVF